MKKELQPLGEINAFFFNNVYAASMSKNTLSTIVFPITYNINSYLFVYRRLAKDTNFFAIVLPVTFYWKKHEICMTLDFSLLLKYNVFSLSAIKTLKSKLGWDNFETVSAKHLLKRQLEEMLATGLYKSRTELARAAGLSDSYVCRVLKHRS
jgi:hypothetical protein